MPWCAMCLIRLFTLIRRSIFWCWFFAMSRCYLPLPLLILSFAIRHYDTTMLMRRYGSRRERYDATLIIYALYDAKIRDTRWYDGAIILAAACWYYERRDADVVIHDAAIIAMMALIRERRLLLMMLLIDADVDAMAADHAWLRCRRHLLIADDDILMPLHYFAMLITLMPLRADMLLIAIIFADDAPLLWWYADERYSYDDATLLLRYAMITMLMMMLLRYFSARCAMLCRYGDIISMREISWYKRASIRWCCAMPCHAIAIIMMITIRCAIMRCWCDDTRSAFIMMPLRWCERAMMIMMLSAIARAIIDMAMLKLMLARRTLMARCWCRAMMLIRAAGALLLLLTKRPFRADACRYAMLTLWCVMTMIFAMLPRRRKISRYAWCVIDALYDDDMSIIMLLRRLRAIYALMPDIIMDALRHAYRLLRYCLCYYADVWYDDDTPLILLLLCWCAFRHYVITAICCVMLLMRATRLRHDDAADEYSAPACLMPCADYATAIRHYDSFIMLIIILMRDIIWCWCDADDADAAYAAIWCHTRHAADAAIRCCFRKMSDVYYAMRWCHAGDGAALAPWLLSYFVITRCARR